MFNFCGPLVTDHIRPQRRGILLPRRLTDPNDSSEDLTETEAKRLAAFVKVVNEKAQADAAALATSKGELGEKWRSSAREIAEDDARERQLTEAANKVEQLKRTLADIQSRKARQ